MTLDELSGEAERGTLVLESLPGALYQAYFEVNGATYPLLKDGKAIRTYSVGKMYEILGHFRFKRAMLRQHSAYDEMVGQPGGGSNTLTVP